MLSSTSSLLLILIFVMGIILKCVDFWKNRKLYYYASKIDGPPAYPLIGSAHYLIGGTKRIVNNVVYLVKKYKSPWKIWLGPSLFIIITDPQDLNIILNNHLEKSKVYGLVEPVFREGLFTAPVEKWKKHRKVIVNTFNMQILNGFVDIFAENATKLVVQLEKFVNCGLFDILPYMTECSLKITCETTMGQNGEDQSQYISMFARSLNLLFQRVVCYWLHSNKIWKMTSYYKELDCIIKQLENIVKQIIVNKQIEYETRNNIDGAEKRKVFLDHMIEICNSERINVWSEEELIDEVQTLMAAGSDSLGSIQSFTMMMLGMHPDIQEKVHEEIQIILDDRKKITSDDLSKLKYLENVIKETIRLFPVTFAIGRTIHKNIKIQSSTIPAGANCIIAVLYLHRNPDIWHNPLKFDPDRFLPEEVEKRHPYSYLAFSAGPRNCIGFKYAMMEMKTVIATLVQNFTIESELKNVSDVDFTPGLVLKSAQGYRISLKKRSN